MEVPVGSHHTGRGTARPTKYHMTPSPTAYQRSHHPTFTVQCTHTGGVELTPTTRCEIAKERERKREREREKEGHGERVSERDSEREREK